MKKPNRLQVANEAIDALEGHQTMRFRAHYGQFPSEFLRAYVKERATKLERKEVKK